jgi:hypothetical protein
MDAKKLAEVKKLCKEMIYYLHELESSDERQGMTLNNMKEIAVELSAVLNKLTL